MKLYGRDKEREDIYADKKTNIQDSLSLKMNVVMSFDTSSPAKRAVPSKCR